jgi:hypothetical protein
MADKSPKTIATINIKGGVGKTTVTRCLDGVLEGHRHDRLAKFLHKTYFSHALDFQQTQLFWGIRPSRLRPEW